MQMFISVFMSDRNFHDTDAWTWKFTANLMCFYMWLYSKCNLIDCMYIPVYLIYTYTNIQTHTLVHLYSCTYVALFTLIAVSDVSLFCKTRDLIQSIKNPTTYCTLSGELYIYIQKCRTKGSINGTFEHFGRFSGKIVILSFQTSSWLRKSEWLSGHLA